jgi:type I restriction enzyme R subunit
LIERKLDNLIRLNGCRYDFLVRFPKMLDSGLPEKYTTDLFEAKCGALFQHVLEKYPESGVSVYQAGA